MQPTMIEQPKQTRRRDRARMNAVTSAVGVSGIAGALALAVNLPGSTHSSSSSSSSGSTSTAPSTNSTTTTQNQGTTTTSQAPQSTTQAPQATSGGS